MHDDGILADDSLPLPVEGQLLSQEQVLRCQCGARSDTREAEPKDVDPQRGLHMPEIPQRRHALYVYVPSPRLA